MNYLLDKKIKRNKFLKYSVFFILLFILLYFGSGVIYSFSSFSHTVFKPFFILENNFNKGVFNFVSYFSFKNSLTKENESLKQKILEQEARIINYDSILDENLKLKEILGRQDESKNFLLATILSKPNRSIFDTLIIDLGYSSSVSLGSRVFALGNIPIGYIAEVYENTSKVVLYSSPKEKTEVVITGNDTYLEIIGRGGGNFEITLPREFILDIGTKVVSTGIKPFVIGVVETIISDQRDSFKKALLVSPVNIQDLKFVEIEK